MRTPDSHAGWSYAGAGEVAECPDSIENVNLEDDGDHLLTHWGRDEWFWAEGDSFVSLEEMR